MKLNNGPQIQLGRRLGGIAVAPIASVSSPAFSPADIDGLTLWLDAAQLTGLNDGDAVATWPDMSGSGYDATQATGTKRPTYKTGIANGKPVVRFDGGDALVTDTVDFQGAGAITIFTVVKHAASGVDHMYVEASPVYTSNENSFIFYRTSANVVNVAANGSPGGAAWYSRRQPPTSRYAVITGIVDFSLPSPISFASENSTISFHDGLRANGTNGGGIADLSGAPYVGNYPLYIGARNQSNTYFNGDMAELLIYLGRLTAAQRRQVQAYLNAKWGISYADGILVTIGDSMTAGTNATNPYPDQLAALLTADGADYNWGNYGRNGTQTGEMETYAAQEVDVWRGLNGGRNIAVVWGGTNDFYFGKTLASTQSGFQTLCANRQAAGWTVIALTMLPRSDAFVPADFETKRAAFNTWLRANYTDFADVLVDVAADDRIGDAGDSDVTTYYTTDKVHLNNTGLGLIAAAVKDAIDALP